MKKIISLILILSMAAALGACGSKTENATTAPEVTATAAAEESSTVKLDDEMVRLGKLVKLEETPFIMKSLILKSAEGAMGNYDTFKPGETVEFYINAAVSEANAAKVKIHLAPYVAKADKVPENPVLTADYATPAEAGGVNFKITVPSDTEEGYYNLIFAYENTVAYRISIKIAK